MACVCCLRLGYLAGHEAGLLAVDSSAVRSSAYRINLSLGTQQKPLVKSQMPPATDPVSPEVLLSLESGFCLEQCHFSVRLQPPGTWCFRMTRTLQPQPWLVNPLGTDAGPCLALLLMPLAVPILLFVSVQALPEGLCDPGMEN